MKNITVLAVAFVVWFALSWWLAGVELNRGREVLVFMVTMLLGIGICVLAVVCFVEQKMFDKFGKDKDR